MARPNLSDERRQELIGTVAATFAELGYRRTTTAELAARCGLQEQALYRLWPDKRAMFVASIEFVGAHSEAIWRDALARDDGGATGAERVLAHESTHLGEFGLYRILFAGLSEIDDTEIKGAMRRVYASFLRFIEAQVEAHRGARTKGLPPVDLTAWALVGLGTVINLGRELDLLKPRARRQLFAQVGQHLLG